MQKRTVTKGFVFTFEAILTMLLFTLMLFAIPTQTNPNLKEVLILQQSNDLLRVWSQTYPTEQEMISDAKIVFQNNSTVKINGKELITCQGKNKISTEGILLDDLLVENNITIIVCYN